MSESTNTGNEANDLRALISELEQTKRELTRELSVVKGDLTRVSATAKASEDLIAKRDQELAESREHLKDAMAESRERRLEIRKIEESRDNLANLHAEVEKDRDEWKARAETDPDGLRKKMSEYETTIRGIKHERAFEKVGKTLGVTDPTKFADLIALARYEPDGDDPDEAKIGERFSEVIKVRDWLKDAAPPATTATGDHPANGTGQTNVQANGTIPATANANGSGNVTANGNGNANGNGSVGTMARPAPAPIPGQDRGTSVQTQQVDRYAGRPVGKL